MRTSTDRFVDPWPVRSVCAERLKDVELGCRAVAGQHLHDVFVDDCLDFPLYWAYVNGAAI